MTLKNIFKNLINIKTASTIAPDPAQIALDEKLIAAVVAANVEDVELYLEQGANPNVCQSGSGIPIIILAASSDTNSLAMVGALIFCGRIPLDIDQTNSNVFLRLTALSKAISANNMRSASLLLSAGANFNTRCHKSTKLFPESLLQCKIEGIHKLISDLCKLEKQLGTNMPSEKSKQLEDAQQLKTDAQQLGAYINKLRKSSITPSMLDTYASKIGRFFAKTVYYNFTKKNKKLSLSIRLIPEEILMLIGEFTYPKSRLNNHFLPSFKKTKTKLLHQKPKLITKPSMF
jgi:DNA-binding protein H-NS